ncbi:MAG TPA: DUF4288 domain-containing protein [Ferruginibacter sp.]|nr:DUF4288 domain-containing protein [Ferruginibacter sp.]
MNWYLAKIVFKIICGNGNHAAQFDEQLRLVNANTKMLALQKAIELGKSEEDMFLNIHQQPVHWQFVNVSELYKMEELLDGAELYSTIKEVENGEQYEKVIHHKANRIVSTPLHSTTLA